MRQQKAEHHCEQCGAPMKKNIGAQTRKKYWVCTNSQCGKRRPA